MLHDWINLTYSINMIACCVHSNSSGHNKTVNFNLPLQHQDNNQNNKTYKCNDNRYWCIFLILSHFHYIADGQIKKMIALKTRNWGEKNMFTFLVLTNIHIFFSGNRFPWKLSIKFILFFLATDTSKYIHDDDDTVNKYSEEFEGNNTQPSWMTMINNMKINSLQFSLIWHIVWITDMDDEKATNAWKIGLRSREELLKS